MTQPFTDRQTSDFFFETLSEYRELVLRRIRELIPSRRFQSSLYGPMFEYPLRQGKGFRPALCLAMCQACGGRLEDALDTAATLEMFHNAFLIHDDVADESELRRGLPTLHSKYGVGIATNVGDAMNMLAMRVLIDNTETLGLERALAIVEEICRMAQETTQGQAIELDWIRNPVRELSAIDYLRMIRGKTCWYTAITPMRVGALIADCPRDSLGDFIPFGFRIGAAFQIQDDILNLVGSAAYGKEIAGDLAEGKRTLIIIHAMNTAPARARKRVERIYAKSRNDKSVEDLEFVQSVISQCGSITFAKDVAHRLTMKAHTQFQQRFHWLEPGPHKRFIEEMIRYMITRKL